MRNDAHAYIAKTSAKQKHAQGLFRRNSFASLIRAGDKALVSRMRYPAQLGLISVILDPSIPMPAINPLAPNGKA
jgi:hypothetical protein